MCCWHLNSYHGCGIRERNKQIIIAQRFIQRDIIIKYRFPSLSVTVSHGKLKNELRTRDNHELRLSVNPEDDFTDGGDAVPLCVTSSISLSRLPSCSRAPPSLPSTLITIFAVGGTTVTFYRCELLVRAASVLRLRTGVLLFSVLHAYSREKRGFAIRFSSIAPV